MDINTETWVKEWWDMHEQVDIVETGREVTGWLTAAIDR